MTWNKSVTNLSLSPLILDKGDKLGDPACVLCTLKIPLHLKIEQFRPNRPLPTGFIRIVLVCTHSSISERNMLHQKRPNYVFVLTNLSVNTKMYVYVFLISNVARTAVHPTYSLRFLSCTVFTQVFSRYSSDKAGCLIDYPRIGERRGVLNTLHRPVISYTDISNCLLI